METCKTKESLIDNYAQNYDPKFYREWINLSLRKLSGFKTSAGMALPGGG